MIFFFRGEVKQSQAAGNTNENSVELLLLCGELRKIGLLIFSNPFFTGLIVDQTLSGGLPRTARAAEHSAPAFFA